MTYTLEIQLDHLLHLCITWQSNITPIPCAKALPLSWGPTEAQLQCVAIYKVMADWGTASQSTQYIATANGESDNDFEGESDGLAGELFASVEAADLANAYHGASDLLLYFDVDLTAQDLQTTK